MAAEPKSQRTERPTARRLQRAREKGQVARSPEIPGVLVLAGFLVFCKVFGAAWLDQLSAFCAASLSTLQLTELTPSRVGTLLNSTIWATLGLLIAPLGTALTAGVAGNLIQGTPPLTFEPLKPNWSKLSPSTNLGRLFSIRPWVETLKMLLKLALYGAVAYTAARDALLHSSIGTPGVGGAFQALFALAWTVIYRVTLLAAGLALLDYGFRRYEHTHSLMMTKREVKDDRRDAEGDPLVRARMRSRMMALGRTRMMAAVPKATVVVTNPEHVAVALRYEPGESDVPQVLAKGRELLAARIREIAAEHGVPIISDPPLARALYRSVPIGAGIPPALFRAVAEVLALVLRPGARA